MSLPFHTWKHNSWVNDFTINQLKQLKPSTVYDVGCGDGFYGKLIKYLLPETNVIGVELNGKWVNHCKGLREYDKIIQGSIINEIKELSGELIIFGDILEHLEKEDMENTLKTAIDNFSYVILNGPVGFQPQFHEDPEEIHRCGISKEDLNNYQLLEYNESDFGKDANQMMNALIKGNFVI